jgi:hypothetical protein
VLNQRIDEGNPFAPSRLADLLVEHDRLDEALVVLRRHTEAGDWYAGSRLVAVLAEQGRVAELEDEVTAGTWGAVGEVDRLNQLMD